MVNGGFQFDRDEISSIDEKELKEIAFSLLKEEKNLIKRSIFHSRSSARSPMCSDSGLSFPSILCELIFHSFYVLQGYWKEKQLQFSTQVSDHQPIKPQVPLRNHLKKYKIPRHKLFHLTVGLQIHFGGRYWWYFHRYNFLEKWVPSFFFCLYSNRGSQGTNFRMPWEVVLW